MKTKARRKHINIVFLYQKLFIVNKTKNLLKIHDKQEQFQQINQDIRIKNNCQNMTNKNKKILLLKPISISPFCLI